MNKEQKAAAVDEIAERLGESDAIFAVDYRGISVPEAAELRARLREADATFRVVKNRHTEWACAENTVMSCGYSVIRNSTLRRMPRSPPRGGRSSSAAATPMHS